MRNSRSDGISMIACATASVTTSASVTLRLAFFSREGRRSSAVANTAVRSKSRSASIVAPRSTVRTDAPTDFDCSSPNAFHDHLGRGINHLGAAELLLQPGGEVV